jgi:hypothetical protein
MGFVFNIGRITKGTKDPNGIIIGKEGMLIHLHDVCPIVCMSPITYFGSRAIVLDIRKGNKVKAKDDIIKAHFQVHIDQF